MFTRMKTETFPDGSTIDTDEQTGNRTVCGSLAHAEYLRRLRAEQVAGLSPHTQINLDAFNEQLAKEYERLFRENPEYAYAAAHTTASALARKMTLGLASGSANKDGLGIKRTCAHFGIAYSYRAIRTFFDVR